uniref:Uncharacterized protein n=1 Tax=Arion vulgaris TaxID=1028688 RepID=A0A0B6XVZ6_9EUPU
MIKIKGNGSYNTTDLINDDNGIDNKNTINLIPDNKVTESKNLTNLIRVCALWLVSVV